MIEPFNREDEPIDVDEICDENKPVADSKKNSKKRKTKLQFVWTFVIDKFMF